MLEFRANRFSSLHWQGQQQYTTNTSTFGQRLSSVALDAWINMQDIKNLVRKFLLDNFVMGGNTVIADDSSFMKNHILDSTGFIELVSFIEETFGVKVDDDEMLPENFDSLLNIEDYVGRKRVDHARN